jgi:hypothetical protein
LPHPELKWFKYRGPHCHGPLKAFALLQDVNGSAHHPNAIRVDRVVLDPVVKRVL